MRREGSGRKKLDISGKRFGRLIATKFIRININENNSRNTIWECRCDCGKVVRVNLSAIRSGQTLSCGCFQVEQVKKSNRKAEGEAAARLCYLTYKNNAKKRDLIFNLSFSYFFKVVTKECYYCGIAPSNKKRTKRHFGTFLYSGLDRIDNDRGYTRNNVVPCCKRCNFAKHAMSQSEFFNLITKIYTKHCTNQKNMLES